MWYIELSSGCLESRPVLCHILGLLSYIERTILFKNNIIIIEQLLQFVEWMNIHAFSNIRNCVLVLYSYVNVMNFTENGKDQW